MNKKISDDCFKNDGTLLTHDEALTKLLSGLEPLEEFETVSLENGVGRVLAQSVRAPRNIPGHTNSAMDGYGFSHADYDAQAGTSLRVSGMMAAGATLEGRSDPGAAIRIFTGAALPDIYDSVVMQEDVELVTSDDKPHIKIPPGLKRRANVRLAGEDVRTGAVVLDAPRRLSPQDLAAIASTGTVNIECYRPLKVAIFSTGDEVIRPGTKYSHGKVYDSNGAMLRGLVASTGADCDDLGVLPDDLSAIRNSLREAAKTHDVLLTSGGVSVGDLDHVLAALQDLGSVHLWKIAIKPGRPMSFGQIDECLMLGLPGNPVAAFLCFLLYAHPVLAARSGQLVQVPMRYPLPAGFSMTKKPGRREFLRGVLGKAADGAPIINKYARDGSGLISSLTKADGFIELAEDVTQVEPGDLVNFVPFSSFGL